MRKSVKRALVVGSAVVAVSGAGVAYAAWTASGTGAGYAKAGTATALSTMDVSASTVGDLYPGGDGTVVVKIHNPNPYKVKVTAISGSGAITASGGTGTCTTTGVSFTNQSGSWTIPANTDTQVVLSHAASMDQTSDDG